MLLVSLSEGEVALLLEDLARGGRLGPIRHLSRRLDRLGELPAQPVSFGHEGVACVVPGIGRHASIVRPFEPFGGMPPCLSYTPGEYKKERAMAIEIDPVCGMQVDTETSDLKLEHEGKTYWFCGKGCLLEFRDDPQTYLDPSYQPSM
jgi:YHS domain-containing protein